MTPREQHCAVMTGASYATRMSSQTVAAQTRPAWVQTRQNACTEKKSGHQVPPITKKLFEIDICWKGENQFSL